MELVLQGVGFTIIGMLSVFLFLILMILVMKVSYILITFINKHIPEQDDTVENSIQRSVHSHDDVAVAIAAVKAFTKN